MVREPSDHLMVEAGSLVARMGQRLRARRQELGKTLAEVATPADVSVSYLSSVEKGGNQPSLPVLARIVHALELTIADVLRAEGHNWLTTNTINGLPGTRLLSHDGLQLHVVEVTAQPTESGKCPVSFIDREVFAYVLAGALIVTIDGEEYELRTGDALDARSPRSVDWSTAGATLVSVIWASTRYHGETS